MINKILLTVCIMAVSYTAAISCDGCSGASSSNYIGLLPDFKNNIVGVRYRTNSLTTHINANGTYSYLTQKETYTSAEVWANIRLNNNLRINAVLPYNILKAAPINGSNTSADKGLGDISLLAFYKLLNKQTPVKQNLLFNSLWIAAGVKLPTGKYIIPDHNASYSTNIFQLGTGSYDVLTQLMHDVRYNRVGLATNAMYKINMPNVSGYRYGNKLAIGTQLYCKANVGNITLAPNIGIMYEHSESDADNEVVVNATKGYQTTANIGLELNYNKIVFGALYGKPIKQQWANNTMLAHDKLMLHVGVRF